MNPNNPCEKKLIAICGGIGTGKSTVARILREMNFTVIDCDLLARKVSELPEIIAKIQALFGEDVISDGKINRRALRAVAFTSAENVQKMNDVFFEKVYELIFAEAAVAAGKAVFAEVTAPSALKMFPGGFNEVWEICANETTCVRRVVFRDNVSEREVREIMSRQEMPKELIVRTINNDGGVDELKAKIENCVRSLQ